MNMKYMYIVSMIIIAMISIGCVNKPSEKVSLNETPTQTNMPTITDTTGNDNASPPGVTEVSGNESSPGVTEVSGNESSSGVTEVSGNESSSEVIGVSNNTPSPGVTGMSTEDTSVTQIFNIGDEKTMLGVKIKLVNITDYDNNSVVLLINGVEYKYESETTVQASGIEVVDIVALEDNKTAEITVDHISQ